MTKMIALRDEAYEYLASLKLKGESFSQLVFRLKEMLSRKKQRKSLLEFAGILSHEEGEEALRRIREMRESDREHDYSW